MQIFRQVLTASFISAMLYASGFFIFWSPLPLFYLSFSKKREVWWLSLGALFSTAVIFYRFISPPHFFNLFHLFFYLTAAVFLSLGVWKKWPAVTWGLLQGFGVASILFLIGFFIQKTGIFNISQVIQISLEETSVAFEEMIKKPEFLRERPEMIPILLQMKRMIFFFPKLIPAFLFILSIVVMVCNIGILRYFDICRQGLSWVGKFRSLHLPPSLIWILIAAGGGYFLNAYFSHQEWLKVASLNGVLMAGFVYFIQGLSIATFFMRRFSPLFRILIYGLVLLFLEVFGLIVVGLGVANVWVDFRKLNKAKS